jgi:hypothetical protein
MSLASDDGLTEAIVRLNMGAAGGGGGDVAVALKDEEEGSETTGGEMDDQSISVDLDDIIKKLGKSLAYAVIAAALTDPTKNKSLNRWVKRMAECKREESKYELKRTTLGEGEKALWVKWAHAVDADDNKNVIRCIAKQMKIDRK